MGHSSLSQFNKLAAKDLVLSLPKVEFFSDRYMARPILEKTPYELLRGRKPNITHLISFGCKCFTHNNDKEALGLQDEDYDIELIGEEAPKEPEPQPKYGSIDHKEVDSDHEEREEERTTLTANQTDESVPTEHVPFVLFLGVQTRLSLRNLCALTTFLSQVEPKNIKEALKDPNWIIDMQEELNYFERSKVRHLVQRPKNRTNIGNRWVFRNKLDKQGDITRNKARLMVQGYNQEESIDYDETFAPVARTEAIRMLIAFAAHMEFTLYHMDVKGAFLNIYLKQEVFVKQPSRFESEEFPECVQVRQSPAWTRTGSKSLV
ncbi:uncharacterized protein LOC142175169 [Nicotiana tabacum]|uniref:Uncharacterized protein LOC142175169 n=1 Tax=Nicotiana tabacum TaxID=4097 RepID=A0AC58TKU5_TOBAC